MNDRTHHLATPEGRTPWLAFAVAFSVLALQLVLNRIVSVKLLNNFAFLVISITMLGLAASGPLLALGWVRRTHLHAVAAACSLSAMVASALFTRAPAPGLAELDQPFVWTFLQTLGMALPFAVPFACCGLILGMLVTMEPGDARRTYAWDLAGSALGAVASVPLVNVLGAERAALMMGLLVPLAVALWQRPATLAARAGLVAAVVCPCVGLVFPDVVFRYRYPERTPMARAEQPGSGYQVERLEWDAASRIELLTIPTPDLRTQIYPSLIGTDTAFHASIRKTLTQNNYAFTYAPHFDGNPASLRGFKGTVYSAAYVALGRPPPHALTIGVGGGMDILTALAWDARRVTGVEINAATLRLLREDRAGYFAPWVTHPAVELVHADGRHHLASHPEVKADVLQLSGVDTYAGTAGNAQVFSESFLYTREAVDLFLDRLAPDGVLNVMRLDHGPPRDMMRMLATLLEALRARGVQHPRDHLMVLAQGTFTFVAILVRLTPFTAEDIQRVETWAGTVPLTVQAAPDRVVEGSHYSRLASRDDPAGEARLVDNHPFDIAPVLDDRPFFFRTSRWSFLWAPPPGLEKAALPELERSILALLVLMGAVALLVVGGPLVVLRRRQGALEGAWRFGLFMAGTGLGYLALEVALMQRLGLLLGHPNHAVTVTLAVLLASSGLGSRWSGHLVRAAGSLFRVSLMLALVTLLLAGVALPWADGLVGLPFALRVGVVALLVAPLGVLLGAYVPTALVVLRAADDRHAAWAWGVSGMASVVAPVLAMAWAVTWGFTTLMLLAVPLYMALPLVLPDANSEAA